MTINKEWLSPKSSEYNPPGCVFSETDWLEFLFSPITTRNMFRVEKTPIITFDGQKLWQVNTLKKNERVNGPINWICLEGDIAGTLAANLDSKRQVTNLTRKDLWNIDLESTTSGAEGLLLRPLINWDSPLGILTLSHVDFYQYLQEQLINERRGDLIEDIENLDEYWYVKLMIWRLKQMSIPVDANTFRENSIGLSRLDLDLRTFFRFDGT